MKNKPRFMTGFNAGSRHAALAITPPEFTMVDKTEDFKAGYRYGIRDRRAGILTDNEAATGAIDMAWHTYSNGGEVPSVTL